MKIWFRHLLWKFKFLVRKFAWGSKAKHCWVMSTNFWTNFWFKSLLTMTSNVLPLRLKQNFLPIIWIFTEGEGDEIESRLPFKIFSTLFSVLWAAQHFFVCKIRWFYGKVGLKIRFSWKHGVSSSMKTRTTLCTLKLARPKKNYTY